MTSQTTLPALEPLPPVVEAVRAAGVRLERSKAGVLVGHCPPCGRRQATLYVSPSGWFQCFACGRRGGAKDVERLLVQRRAA